VTADNRFNEKFGRSLKKLRNELGLTQNELAEMMGWTEKHLSHVENGRKLSVFAKTLYNLRTKSGMSIDKLIDDIQKELGGMILSPRNKIDML
jgi:transcriptional regulator with XRE-family HTH domain